MQTGHLSPCEVKVVAAARALMAQEQFCVRHRSEPRHFTRRRRLTFMKVLVLAMQKTVRSVQLHLHEFFDRLGQAWPAVTASAWCQARLKLRHTAFIELNQT